MDLKTLYFIVFEKLNYMHLTFNLPLKKTLITGLFPEYKNNGKLLLHRR